MEKLSTRAAGLLSAALRHIRDAEHLADASHSHASLDEAFHLAGFGPECARKATMSDGSLDKAIGHGAGMREALDAALALDVVAHRYGVSTTTDAFPALGKWTVDCRYAPTGSFPLPDVGAVLAEARVIVDAISLALWADGRIPRSFAW